MLLDPFSVFSLIARAMWHVKQFEAERREWEEERRTLDGRCSKLEEEKRQLNEEVQRLNKMLESAVAPQMVVNGSTQDHHRQQVVLLATIDKLRNELNVANAKNMAHSSSKDRLSQASTLEPEQQSDGREEIVRLEDENLQLREELNAEKQRILDLKAADRRRRAEWKTELAQIQEDLDQKQKLKELVVRLRSELTSLRAQHADSEERHGRRESWDTSGSMPPSASVSSSTPPPLPQTRRQREPSGDVLKERHGGRVANESSSSMPIVSSVTAPFPQTRTREPSRDYPKDNHYGLRDIQHVGARDGGARHGDPLRDQRLRATPSGGLI